MFKKILFLLCAFTLLTSAQQVETLVQGPSYFNDGLAVDKHGNIYASEYYGQTVTKISKTGETSIFVNGLDSPNGLTFGADGYLYVPNVGTNQIFKVDSTGNKSVFAEVPRPSVLYFLDDTTMMAGSYTNNSLYIVDTGGNVEVWHSGSPLNGPIGILNDDAGNLYIGNFTNGKIFKVDSTKNFVEIADLPGWMGFMTMAGGDIYATAYNRNKIYKIPTDGSEATVFAGTGASGNADGSLMESTFNTPNGIASSITGDTIYISQYNTRSLRMITGMLTPTSIPDKVEIPEKIYLNQNYPNPFNPSTKINFSLPEPSRVTLKVYNVLGEFVAELLDAQVGAGNHEIDFNAKNISAGLYFYRLEAGNFNSVKKMMLVK